MFYRQELSIFQIAIVWGAGVLEWAWQTATYNWEELKYEMTKDAPVKLGFGLLQPVAGLVRSLLQAKVGEKSVIIQNG